MSDTRRILQDITRDLRDIYKRLGEVELTGVPDTSGTVPGAGTIYNHLEDNGANWISVTDLNLDDDAFLYFGAGQDTSLEYDSGNNRLQVTGVDWLFSDLDVALSSSANLKPLLTLENTNADNASPLLDFYKNSASPADGDNIALIEFQGNTSTGAKERYAYIYSETLDVTNGDIGGNINFAVRIDDTDREILQLTGYNGAVGQGEVVINQPGIDIDFRVASDNQTHMLFSDAANDVIGIRSSTPATVAEGLHVPWITGDSDATAQFGSANASNNQNAIEAFSDSGYGVLASSTDLAGMQGSTATGIGVEGVATTSGAGGSFKSDTGTGLVVNLTGAGAAIADFNDNGTSVLTIQDGGNILLGSTATLDLNGILDCLILDTDADTTISAPTDDQIDFEAGGSDIAHINATGLGVGVVPSNPLEIFHATINTLALFESGDNAAAIQIKDDDTTAYLTVNSNALSMGLNAAVSTSNINVNPSGGVGIGIVTALARLHVDQSSTTAAIPVLTLDQADVSEEMINFVVAATGAGNPVDTATAVGAAYARLRIAVNGTFKYIQLYDA